MFKRIALGLIISLFWFNSAFANKYPILIVHGINGESQTFKDACLVKTLKEAGFEVYTLADVGGDFPNRGQELIQEDVKQLKKAIDEVKRLTGAEKVDIVAHSRGGLVTELYTMMYEEKDELTGEVKKNQYQPEMKYTYRSAKGDKKDIITKSITNIPHYGDDINQVIMMATPQKGSKWADKAHDSAMWRWIIERLPGDTDCSAVGYEQLQEDGSVFMGYFWQQELNPKVDYNNLAEDRRQFGILRGKGDGVVSFESACGVKLHQERKETIGLGEGNPTNTPSWVGHSEIYKDLDVRKLLLKKLFFKNPIVAEITIIPEKPVKGNKIDITVKTSYPLLIVPKLYVKGQGEFVNDKEIPLTGSSKDFTGKLNIPAGTEGDACLYIYDIDEIEVMLFSPAKKTGKECSEGKKEQIVALVKGGLPFTIGSLPDVTSLVSHEGNTAGVLTWGNPIADNFAGVFAGVVVVKKEGAIPDAVLIDKREYNKGDKVDNGEVVYVGESKKDAFGLNYWEIGLTNEG